MTPAFCCLLLGQPRVGSMNVRVDRETKRVLMWVRNSEGKKVTLKIRVARWNDAPVKGKFPRSVVLDRGKQATIVFEPVHPDVADYGHQVYIAFDRY